MLIRFCQFCGEPLENLCNCEKENCEEIAQTIEDYENNLQTKLGWVQQDAIDNWRSER